MSRAEIRLPAPEGVAPGQPATFRLSIGRRYHELYLIYSGVTLAQLTEIRIYVNNKVVQTFSGVFRDLINKFDRRQSASGILTIPFDRYGLDLQTSREETALNTDSFDDKGRGISSVYMEVDIDPAATAPKLSLKASVSEKIPGGAGSILYVMRNTRTASGAGYLDISDMPRNTMETVLLNRVFFTPSANAILDVEVERNIYTIFERDAALNTKIQLENKRTPQGDTFGFDLTERGIGGNLIQLLGVSDFNYKLNLSGAASVTIHSEYLGSLSG